MPKANNVWQDHVSKGNERHRTNPLARIRPRILNRLEQSPSDVSV
jgi:hypothetical protein